MEGFGARLRHAIDTRGPLCVGLDPHAELLRSWELGDDVDGLRRFCGTVVEAIGDVAAVVKPQSAFFERHGSGGVEVLESTIRQLRDTGALVLLDVKRGDIGSTAVAYAQAYLDPASSLAVDAITASPFLGFGSLFPMIDMALSTGSGVFVLALTSNPEGAAVQRARSHDGRTVAQTILDEVSQVNAGVQPLGSIGVVIGPEAAGTGHETGRINGPVLVPGMGEQGGRPEHLHVLAHANAGAVLPSYSRQVLRAGPGGPALRDATQRARDACATVLKV
ncbi:MAG TPA: orotidine-5'-phosphate decarboxylase [Micromonosporaceae bacterium]|nr:orotidine-5'-phosphate decarboxylase [Micromonosporaceae bacterium]